MGRKRLYLPGTQVIFAQHNPAAQNVPISKKDGNCKWCGLMLRKQLLSTHVKECRDKHKSIRML